MTWSYPKQCLLKAVGYPGLKFRKVNREETVGDRNRAWWEYFYFKEMGRAHLRRR